jgi:hypothetical protein
VGHLLGHERRPDPLVLDHQLDPRHLLPLGNLDDDNGEDAAEGHREVQRRREFRRNNRRNRLEVGPRRRLPTPEELPTVRRGGRFRHSDFPDGVDHSLYVRRSILRSSDRFVAVFAMLGMLSPASRGALTTAAIFLYMFMGLVAGYFSARLYKTMKGREWKRAAFLTAVLYPAIIACSCFFLNFFIWGKASSGAVPFSTMISLLFMWVFISLPLVYLGYYFGFRKQPYQHPVRTNQIPRQVPDQHWYMNPFLW